MKKSVFTFLALTIAWSAITAQVITPVTGGFITPIGITRDENGDLLVTSPGTGADDGSVKLVKPNTGETFTVIEGLPSHFDSMSQETSGSWRSYPLGNNMLAVLVGKGTHADAGTLLTYDISGYTPGDVPFTLADAVSKVHISDWVYANGYTDSNPFSLTWEANGDAYVSDAGANAIIKIKASNGLLSTVDVFPPIPNTYTPFPPVIDYVPTAIVKNPAGGFLVSNLTGFPFVPGISSVVNVTPGSGHTSVVEGLTQATDMVLDDEGDLYVLQFGVFDATFSPIFNSASIVQASSTGTIDTLAMGFGPSAGMCSDGDEGFYVTTLFTGQVLHITFPTPVAEVNNTLENVSVFPNPVNDKAFVKFSTEKAENITISATTVAGLKVFEEQAGFYDQGEHTVPLDDLGKLPGGMYLLSLSDSTSSRTVKFVVKR